MLILTLVPVLPRTLPKRELAESAVCKGGFLMFPSSAHSSLTGSPPAEGGQIALPAESGCPRSTDTALPPLHSHHPSRRGPGRLHPAPPPAGGEGEPAESPPQPASPPQDTQRQRRHTTGCGGRREGAGLPQQLPREKRPDGSPSRRPPPASPHSALPSAAAILNRHLPPAQEARGAPLP